MQSEWPSPGDPQCLQQIVVVGCCGAGKSTLSARLAQRLGVAHIERDALGELDSDIYRTTAASAVGTRGWVFDGAPYFVDHLVYPAAHLVIWLDYSRPLILWQTVRRSLRRTFALRKPGERLRQWVAPGGPRYANSIYSERRREFGQLHHRPELAGKVLRFGTPAATRVWLATLEDAETQPS